MTISFQAASALWELGDTDCESIGAGLLNQPVNALSSLTYTVFGLWLVVRALRHGSAETPIEVAYGAALASVGIGSVAFHGPVPPGARLIHDLTIAAVLAFILARGVGTLRSWDSWQMVAVGSGIITVTGAVMAMAPDTGNFLSGTVGIAAVLTEIVLYRTGRRRFSRGVTKVLAATVGLLLVAAVINVLGRTDGPLCDPESVFQGHALWHVLTAAAFMVYGYAAFPHVRTTTPDLPS